MDHFRAAVNRLIDLSERDGRTVEETIEMLEYYFKCLKNPYNRDIHGRIIQNELIMKVVKKEKKVK